MAEQSQKAPQPVDEIRLQRLAELLDGQTEWPTEYSFKFIVPETQLAQAVALFQGEKVRQRQSRTGKYVSVSCKRVVASSSEVIDLYRRAAEIPELVAL